ncbi:hypothetical protein JCM14036_18140 [Desulfotomaculum defluvii]
MDLTTKCRDCNLNGKCRVKNSLNEVVQKVIRRTEESIRKETSLDVDFIIVTDVTLIPTSCSYFVPKENAVGRTINNPGFIQPLYTV